MERIAELYDAYLAKLQEERKINERIIERKRQIERLEKKKDKIGGWHANLVHPLAKVLTPLLGCDSYEILGPFGLRAETSIWFKKKDSTAKYCDYSLCLTVHHEYHQSNREYKNHYCEPPMRTVFLQYDTYKRNTNYQRGSIGELNGFNKIEAPLPETIDELVKIIKENKGE